MLEKLNGVKELKDKLQSLRQSIEEQGTEQKRKADELSLAVREVHSALLDLKGMKADYTERFSSDLEKIKDLQQEFEKALRTFHQDHQKLYDSIYKRLNSELTEHTLPLKEIVGQLVALKPAISEMTKSLNDVRAAFDRLIDLSKCIKKEDFELKAYANELLKMDSEKLRLMKEIDSLKTLIARERRRR